MNDRKMIYDSKHREWIDISNPELLKIAVPLVGDKFTEGKK